MTDLMERMVHFVEDSSLNAGFSRCMNGHMNLRRQYIQAKSPCSSVRENIPTNGCIRSTISRLTTSSIRQQKAPRLHAVP